MHAEVGVERTQQWGGYAMRYREWRGGGLQGKRDPLLLRSGLPPNRAATAYRPGGDWLSFFPFLVPVSLLPFLETAGIGVLWACWYQYPPPPSPSLSLLRSTHERIERRYVKLVKNERTR